MLKNILYFAVMTIALENLCFSADPAGPLKADNSEYMQLMQGLRGILYEKGTPEELRYMIDGCITAGITDRLYGNVQQPMASISNFIPQKKLHVLLAYAFYVLGFGNCTGIGQIKNFLGVHDQPTWSNFDREFAALCALAFDKDTIYQYKNNLEDVIKRTAKGLSFDDFLEERYLTQEEINALQNGSNYIYSGIRSQHPDYSPSQVSETIRREGFTSFVGKFVKKGALQAPPSTGTTAIPSTGTTATAVDGTRDNALASVGFSSKQVFLTAGNTDDQFLKYARMLKVGLPGGTVKAKMEQDGVKFK